MNIKSTLMRHRGKAVLLLVALSGTGWFLSGKKEAAPTERYRLEEISTGNIRQTVSASGAINPVTLVSVGSQVSGTVSKLFVDYNDQVQAGQVIMTLDDSLLRAQLAQSEANLSSAEASLLPAQASYNRLLPLQKDGFVSQQELEEAQRTLAAARAQVALYRAQVQKDRTNLGYTTIRSPVTGVVVSREVDEGQTVAASLSAPTLFKIARDLKQMQIEAYFSEADVGQIRVGQEVNFRVDAFPDERFRGEVRQIRLNSKTESNVVTYNVVINVNNEQQRLLPGMTAYVNVVIAEKESVLRVPTAALRFKPQDSENTTKAAGNKNKSGNGRKESRVYVLEAGKPKAITVQTGISDREFTEITGTTLKSGTPLIVEDRVLAEEKAKSGFQMRM